MSYKLGSLFDGSGGFPLSGTLCDIKPMWAAEVEPYPIAVTRSRFPDMKHLGDISKVKGADIEPVDIITFGSPCQDLSVAGKRAGLKHEDNGDEETTRSGLFMEAVRIIKEMRKATNGKYPRFAVWENVPGAFSSNNGEDFRIVLQELIKITEPYAVMPEVPKGGWAYADTYCGDGWSLAYRVFDAQYWGVPQRRRRIYLVADFGGGCAEKILFEREGLRGHLEKSRKPWEAVTLDVERSIGADDREGAHCYGISSYDSNSMKSDNPNSGIYEAKTARTLDGNGGNPSCNQGGIAVVENAPLHTIAVATQQGGAEITENGICPTITAAAGMSGNNQPWICKGLDGYNQALTGDKSATLGINCGMSTGRNGVVIDTHILDDQGGQQINVRTDGKAPTLRAETHGNLPCVMSETIAYGMDAYNQSLTGDKAKTLNSAASDADHVPCVLLDNIGGDNERICETDIALCLKAAHYKMPPSIAYSVENHPADSRVNLDESGKVQTLTSRMGTGGGNVPMVMEERPSVINLNKNDVQSKTILDPNGIAPSLYAGECRGGGGECYVMEPFRKSARGRFKGDAETWVSAKVANTINTFDQGETRANELVVTTPNALGLDRASFNQGQNAKFDFSILDEQQPTLTARGPGAVCCADTPDSKAFSFDPGASRDVGVLFLEEVGKTLTNGTCPGHHDGVVISHPCHTITTGSFTQIEEEKSPTLMARDYKDPTCVELFDAKERRYIVRRLTPTECARLQGFPDHWGHIEPKTELTDEEYEFWKEVYLTKQIIDGKVINEDGKLYNASNHKPFEHKKKPQMLSWYNKLWADSSEYKMWGNGIALPCALYAIQGIKEALESERTSRNKWLVDLLNT